MKLHQIFSNIKVACLQGKSYITVNYSKFIVNFFTILYLNGFIANFKVLNNFKIKVYITYLSNSLSIFQSLKIMSKGSKKNYISFNKMVFFFNNKFFIVFNSKGLLTNFQVIKKRVGGELVCLRYFF